MKKAVPVRFNEGTAGEAAAARYLTERGYHVLERNFRCRGGEIDLIALDGGTLVFVEVKLRRTLARGTPLEAVTAVKQARVRKAAQQYLGFSGRIFGRIRFDVICIMKSPKTTDITHMKAAFAS
ncbi:MAG TPA: YraN family protein [Candidatus Eremiobacteraceae bacterium]|nr:YraN family protein [Candidatus Eremiobacteraceae bacterium]